MGPQTHLTGNQPGPGCQTGQRGRRITVNTQKLFRILAAPTGPTGTMRGVRVLANFTGATGRHHIGGQINSSQLGPTGTFRTVYAVGATAYAQAPTGTFKTIIVPGYTGPA
jgi:hypothetical protein